MGQLSIDFQAAAVASANHLQEAGQHLQLAAEDVRAALRLKEAITDRYVHIPPAAQANPFHRSDMERRQENLRRKVVCDVKAYIYANELDFKKDARRIWAWLYQQLQLATGFSAVNESLRQKSVTRLDVVESNGYMEALHNLVSQLPDEYHGQ